jgi:hypothetical protein
MTQNGWCRTNYHKDGKRRFGYLTNGLCLECELKTMILARSQTADQIIQLQEKIIDLETERNRLNFEIDRLRFKLHTFVTEKKS